MPVVVSIYGVLAIHLLLKILLGMVRISLIHFCEVVVYLFQSEDDY